MRRKEREITDINEKMSVIAKSKICRLGLSDNNYPYVIPLNYGYSYENEKLTLFFHSAKEGKKTTIIQNNNNACFEVDCETRLIEGEKPCNCSYEFKSVIGFWKVFYLETNDEKRKGLNYLMKHQTEREIKYNFTENELNNVDVYKMVVETFTGKQRIKK